MGRGGEDGQRGDEWSPEDAGASDDAGLLDDVWQDGPGGSRGGLRWLLLLLVIPAVALVVLQLQPGEHPTASPSPTSSETTPAPDTSSPVGGATTGGPQPSRAGRTVKGTRTVRGFGDRLRGISGRWSLFARGDRGVFRIDFAEDELTTTTLPALQSNGPVAFIATGSGVIVRPQDGFPGYLVPDGTQARELTGALGLGGPVVPGPDPGHVWVDTGDGIDHGAVRLVGVDGRTAGPLIAKPANAQDWIRPDGGGYLLIMTSGGVYDARPNVLRRIATGRVVAAGPTGWLAVECNQQNRCARVVVDRSTGDHHPVPGKVTRDSPTEGLIAPDGSSAMLIDQDRSRARLVDLRSGAVHGVDVVPSDRFFFASGVMAWSPDSRWVMLIDGRSNLVAVDARTRTIRHLDLGLPDLDQLSVRPRR